MLWRDVSIRNGLEAAGAHQSGSSSSGVQPSAAERGRAQRGASDIPRAVFNEFARLLDAGMRDEAYALVENHQQVLDSKDEDDEEV